MQEVIKLLFETKSNGKPLFSNQIDLVNCLLSNSESKYYVPQNDSELFARTQNRLKAYLSQLLSPTVSRNITEDFVMGLTLAISSRLSGDEKKTTSIVKAVVDSIREKNSGIAKAEIKTTPLDQFISDLDSAHYIVIITSRPLEIEIQERSGLPNLRNILFSDLINQLYDENRELKYYRFNFPSEPYADLFWRGLRRILFRQFKMDPSPSLFQSLRIRSISNIDTTELLSDNEILTVVDDTLHYLNSKKHIIVFTNTAPIYGFPLVAIDPSDIVNSKVYTILESERMTLLKFPENETLLWRLFVWDLLKSKKNAGQSVPYSIDSV